MKSFYQTLGLNPRDYMTDVSDDESEATIPSSDKLTPAPETLKDSELKKVPVSKSKDDSKEKLPQKIF
jgi:hypothetical protein